MRYVLKYLQVRMDMVKRFTIELLYIDLSNTYFELWKIRQVRTILTVVKTYFIFKKINKLVIFLEKDTLIRKRKYRKE